MKNIWAWLAVAALIIMSKSSEKETPEGNWTANFSPNEFIPAADRETIPQGARDSLRAIAVNVLQPARNELRLPIRISSGYRNPQRNAAIGGAPASQHMTGQAVDFQPVPATRENFKKLWDILIKNGKYDQIIWENALAFSETPSHIHLSYVVPGLNPTSRYQVNRKRKLQYYKKRYSVIS
jgi:hypothetical protein